MILTLDYVYFARCLALTIHFRICNLTCFSAFVEVVRARADSRGSRASNTESFVVTDALRFWIFELTLDNRNVNVMQVFSCGVIFRFHVLNRLEGGGARAKVVCVILIKFMSIL